MELIIVRHGTTQGNLEKRFVGMRDVPLHPQGEELARRVSAVMPAVEHIYRSPLVRCRQTAELLWPGVAHTVVEELRETDYGPYEGKRHAELQNDPQYSAWYNQPGGPNFADLPVGESAREITERVTVGLKKLAEDAAKRNFSRVAMVSHGGALMSLLARFGLPERPYYEWFCPNCGGFRAELTNDPLRIRITGTVGGESAAGK